jgi:hypothetical protein
LHTLSATYSVPIGQYVLDPGATQSDVTMHYGRGNAVVTSPPAQVAQSRLETAAA